LIEYTLEFLAMSGVQDIYIYCGAHTEKVEAYLQSSKWDPMSSRASPFRTLHIVKSEHATSVGDALRHMDSLDLITGDFLLVHGDLVSNIPIDEALARHRERRYKDKNAIMTMILRNGGLGGHRTKDKAITPVFVVEPSKNRCLHYEEITPLQTSKRLSIDPDLPNDVVECEIRTDLIDCGIDICTPDVLALWAESFDYDVPRAHFLHGVLKDYELNGKTIHTEIVEDHYAARVSSLQMYESVSRDVLGRWTYPLVPDSNLVAGQTYKFERGGLCKENGVVLARTCKAGKRTVLGKDTSIGHGSVVYNSIIGRRCHIGKNVNIRNAFIWDDVVVSDNSTIDRAIIANEVVIGRSCTIQPGALLGNGVHIADNKTISDLRITRAKRKRVDVEGEPYARVPSDPKVVGDGGEGYEYADSDDDSDELAQLSSTLIYSTAHLNISSESISTISSEISMLSDDQPRSRTQSFNSVSDDEDGPTNEAFHHDAVAGLVDALRDLPDLDSARLEFTGLRLSNNATDHQIRRAIATAFAKRIAQLVEHDHIAAPKAVEDTFNKPGALKFITEMAVGIKGEEDDQVDFLVCLQKDLAHRGNGQAILANTVKVLYGKDILETDALLKWWQAAEALGDAEDSQMREVRGLTRAIIEFLEADSDDESEEGSEESDD
jgi:translation initiation factor eIF-2B subunit epsilon